MTIPGGRLPCRGEFIRPPSSARPVTSGSPTSWVTHWPVAIRRSELARDQAAGASIGLKGGALKATRTSGFALLGESLFPNAEKVTKNACPCIRVSLRSTPLIPSTLRGPAYKGHPCRRRPRPFTPLAASMPLAPLHADSIRPPERGVRRGLLVRSRNNRKSISTQKRFAYVPNGNENLVGWKTAKHFPSRSTQESLSASGRENRWVSFALPTLRVGSTTASLHGLSDNTEPPLPGGRAQMSRKGLSGMDAARAAMGQGWPFAAGPWSVTGAREHRRSRGRTQGQAFLLTFSAFGKSEAPSRAKPMPKPSPPMSLSSEPEATSRASSLLQQPLANRSRRPQRRVVPTRQQKRFPLCA